MNKRKEYIDHTNKLELERFKLVKVSTCGFSIHDLMLKSKMKGLDTVVSINNNEISNIDDEIVKTKELLESYEKQNSLSNENIIENKNNLVHNNHLVNNVVNSRNKVKSLAYKKVNTIRK